MSNGCPGGSPCQSGTTLNFTQLMTLWTQNGGSAYWAPLMAAVAISESGGLTCNWNSTGATGLWQIEYPDSAPPGWSQQELCDPNLNAQAALRLFGDGSGLSNWSCCGDKFLDAWMGDGSPTPTADVVEQILNASGLGTGGGGGALPPPGAPGSANTQAAAQPSCPPCVIGNPFASLSSALSSVTSGGLFGGLIGGLFGSGSSSSPGCNQSCIITQGEVRALEGGMLVAAGGIIVAIGAAIVVVHLFEHTPVGTAARAVTNVVPAGRVLRVAGRARKATGAARATAPAKRQESTSPAPKSSSAARSGGGGRAPTDDAAKALRITQRRLEADRKRHREEVLTPYRRHEGASTRGSRKRTTAAEHDRRHRTRPFGPGDATLPRQSNRSPGLGRSTAKPVRTRSG